MLKEIKRGEAYSNRTRVVDDDTVEVAFTVKPDKDSQSRYELEWTLDFAGCTRAEMLTLAVRQIKIDLQAAWRRDPERQEEGKWSDVIIDVAEQLRAKPAKADPVAKVAKLVGQMSDADKAALLAQLQATVVDEEYNNDAPAERDDS